VFGCECTGNGNLDFTEINRVVHLLDLMLHEIKQPNANSVASDASFQKFVNKSILANPTFLFVLEAAEPFFAFCDERTDFPIFCSRGCVDQGSALVS
jgi:hypothetical protein